MLKGFGRRFWCMYVLAEEVGQGYHLRCRGTTIGSVRVEPERRAWRCHRTRCSSIHSIIWLDLLQADITAPVVVACAVGH
jgi:hypothetical protein